MYFFNKLLNPVPHIHVDLILAAISDLYCFPYTNYIGGFFGVKSLREFPPMSTHGTGRQTNCNWCALLFILAAQAQNSGAPIFFLASPLTPLGHILIAFHNFHMM